MSNPPDKNLIRLLYRKLRSSDQSQYICYALPEDATIYSLEENDKNLKDNIGSNASFFDSRFQCLSATIREIEAIDHNVGHLNWVISRFICGSSNEEQFRSLMFMSGL